MSVDDPKTAAIRAEIYRRMSGEEKMALAMKMRATSDAMVRDPICWRSSNLPEDEMEILVHERCDHLDEKRLERWADARDERSALSLNHINIVNSHFNLISSS